MNWYKSLITSSARDVKIEQMEYFRDKIDEAIEQSMIGGEQTIILLNMLIDKMRGIGGYRILIPESVKQSVLSLLMEAKQVKKDSPSKAITYLEEAITYLYPEE